MNQPLIEGWCGSLDVKLGSETKYCVRDHVTALVA